MINIFLLKNKKLKSEVNKQNIYEGENKFDYIYVNLSECVNEFKTSNLNAELRCYVDDKHYVSYVLDTSKEINKIDITYDLTDKPRFVKSLIILTDEENEIVGKTNFVSFSIDKSIEGSKLDPREDLDEIIEEQRAEIAEQAETITTQGETITQQGEQITELNGEVSTLEGTVAEQQATITRQNTTIDELNERRTPVYIPAQLQPKLITPKDTTEYYSPSEGKDGFSAVTVEGATVEALGLNENYYKLNEPFLDKVGKYNPFPENTYGGIYFTELNENNFPVGIKVVNYDFNYNNFNVPGLEANTLKNNIKSLILLVCKNVKIGGRYFENAISLMICHLDGVSSIGTGAFAGCASLRELVLPNSLTSMGTGAFQNCTSLRELVLPNSLTSIDTGAFQNCTSLRELVLPNSLTSIGTSAFQNCTSLRELVLPNSLTSIGMYAFLNCSLRELTLPNSLTSIGTGAFAGCASLTELVLPQGFNCDGLNVSSSTLFTAETIVACLEALADRTGETAYTLTIGTTNINKLTAEQRAIATNKNWNLA